MKKLLSTILCLAMMLSLATPALAASSTTASGIRGEIIYQEGSNSLSRSSPTVTSLGLMRPLLPGPIWIDLTGVAYG